MLCRNCGVINEIDSSFCENCGFALADVPKTKQLITESIQPENNKKFRLVLIISIIAVCLMVLLTKEIVATGVFNPVEREIKLGYKLLAEGKYDEAILAFNKVISIDSKSISARIGASEAHFMLGEYDKAEQFLREVLDLDPDNLEARDWLHKVIAFNGPINNGGYYVQYGGYTYYREYHDDSFEKSAVFARYAHAKGSSKKMMRVDNEGNKEELFTDTGAGKIFIYNNRFYLQCSVLENEISEIYSVDFSGADRKDYGSGSIKTLDPYRGIIVCEEATGDIRIRNTSIINCRSRAKIATVAGKYLHYGESDGMLYFSYHNTPADQIRIGSVRADGYDEKVLFSKKMDFFDDAAEANSVAIQHVQIVDDYLYFSFGSRSGTYNIGYDGLFRYRSELPYNGGVIARIKKDGSNFNVLAGEKGKLVQEKFLVIQKSQGYFLLYLSGRDWHMHLSPVILDIQNGIVEDSSLDVSVLKTPFFESKNLLEASNEISIYADNSGNKVRLLTKEDYSNLGITGEILMEERYYQNTDQVEYLNDWVYFRIENGVRSMGKDLGWRYGYERKQAKIFRKQLSTSKIELLYSY